jgi:EpsI family protein
MKPFFLPISALVLLAASAWVSNALLFKQVIQGQTQKTRAIPAHLGQWTTIEESEVSASEIRGLETQDMIRRIYSDGNHSIELVVAYIAHSSRKSAHAQEACLRGSGAEVGRIETVALENPRLQGKLINLQYHQRRQWVLYFYKIGNLYTSDYLLSSWLMFFGGITGHQHTGASLVRFLTPAIEGESREMALARMQDFAQSLLPDLDKRLP